MAEIGVNKHRIINEDTPLTVAEQHFLNNYIRYGNLAEAVRLTPELNAENKSRTAMSNIGGKLMKMPHIVAEYNRLTNLAKQETQATANEVMEYFTQVMRGEVKDQFGLDAPLSERTRAAQELAKRTVDIENRQKGIADTTVQIKLDWSR